MATTLKVLSPGGLGPEPFTVCIIANPFLESPLNTGVFNQDPMMTAQADFDTAAQYIADCIRGMVPGQAEVLFDAGMLASLRIVSIFETGLAASSANSLVANDNVSGSDLLISRRDSFRPLATRHHEAIDVGIAISAATTHNRATTWAATDDDTGGGVPFTLDGKHLSHRHRALIPGAVAIHLSERSLTPLHEFQHAMGSFTNGRIADLYFDWRPDATFDINARVGRPIPSTFATYQAAAHHSDPVRDGPGYGSWTSYHCALIDSSVPAVMDAYTFVANPLRCQNDTLTRRFLIDRLRARMSR